MFTVFKIRKKVAAVFKTDRLSTLAYDGRKIWIEAGKMQFSAVCPKQDFYRLVRQVLK